MTKRRHGPTFDQVHIISQFGPTRESVPRKLRSPTEPANDGLQHLFHQVSQARLRPDTIDEDDLAAWSEDTGELVECCLGIWHGGNNVMRYDHIERSVRE
jgi:hypothetical protein